MPDIPGEDQKQQAVEIGLGEPEGASENDGWRKQKTPTVLPEQLAIAIRPEDVRLGTDDVIAIDGIISDVIYRGAHSTVLVRTTSGAMVRASVTGATPSVGDQVSVGWDATAMLVLP